MYEEFYDRNGGLFCLSGNSPNSAGIQVQRKDCVLNYSPLDFKNLRFAMSLLPLLLIASVLAAGIVISFPWCVESEVQITSFNPQNGTYMSTIDFPVQFTFSDDVFYGNGCVVFENDFGDLSKACGKEGGITINEKNATIQLKEKYYYGSSYRVFFEDGPFVDSVNNTISLVKGDYVFFINSWFLLSIFICRKE